MISGVARTASAVRARPRLAAAVFVGILSSVAVLTALTPPRYESEATLLALAERDTMLAHMQSRPFETDVADELAARGYTLDAPAVAQQARVAFGARRTVNEDQSLIRIQAHARDAALAADIPTAYLAVLQAWRPRLENATEARVWNATFAASNGDATVARERAQAIARGTHYYDLLEGPVPAAAPVAPSWPLNLLAGGVLSTTAAAVTAEVAQAIPWRDAAPRGPKTHNHDARLKP